MSANPEKTVSVLLIPHRLISLPGMKEDAAVPRMEAGGWGTLIGCNSLGEDEESCLVVLRQARVSGVSPLENGSRAAAIEPAEFSMHCL